MSTVGRLANMLYQLIQLAVREGYLISNPAEGVFQELRKTKDLSVRHKEPLTKEQVEKWIGFIADSLEYREFLPIFTVLLGTGLRVGEFCGLRWEDVDFQKNQISVNHTLHRNMTLDGTVKLYTPGDKSIDAWFIISCMLPFYVS